MCQILRRQAGGLTRIPWIKTHLPQTSVREEFPKKGKAVLVLIHLIKSKPQSSNQRKLKFYSDSCNWTKSGRVRVFTDQAGACEGSGVNVLAQGELHTSAVCTRQCWHWQEGLESLPFSPKVRQLAPLGGHFCWAGDYLVFHWLDLQVMIFALGWKGLLLLWRSPGTLLPENQVPRAQISHALPLPLASGGQFTFLQLSFPGCGRGSSSTGAVGTGWYGNVLRATTAWKHMVIIH